MKQICIVISLLAFGSASYAQTSLLAVVPRSKKIGLQTDSIPSNSNNIALKKHSSPTGEVRICVPSRANTIKKEPLIIIKYGNKEKRMSDKFLNIVSPNDISGVEILKDSSAIAKYGEHGKNGVILISLKPEKFSEYRKKIRAFEAR